VASAAQLVFTHRRITLRTGLVYSVYLDLYRLMSSSYLVFRYGFTGGSAGEGFFFFF